MGYNGNVIHFVADKWLTPSIKYIEHIGRDPVSTTYKISGPSQKRPTDWAVALKSWKDDSLAFFLNGKILYTKSKDT